MQGRVTYYTGDCVQPRRRYRYTAGHEPTRHMVARQHVTVPMSSYVAR